MRVKLLVDGDKPKVSEQELRKVVEGAGLDVDGRRAEMAIVVGGDGIFGRYGRVESLPLLFVGVRSRTATGSKAYLAAAYYDELPGVLKGVAQGMFKVKEYKRLKALKGERVLGEVFTDVYLQRGAESNCVRYRVKIEGESVSIDESAIGDGVVVTTTAGSTGYYSYPDKIQADSLDPNRHSEMRDDEVGVCHVVPTYTLRQKTGEHPLRYTVPWGSRIEITITRKADARLYGVSSDRGGIRVGTWDKITIVPGEGSTKVVTVE